MNSKLIVIVPNFYFIFLIFCQFLYHFTHDYKFSTIILVVVILVLAILSFPCIYRSLSCSMAELGFAIALTVVAYGLYCLYMRYVKKRCSCKTDLTGKTVIVTGSDKGEFVWFRLNKIVKLCPTPPPLASTWPHLRCDVGLQYGEY